MDLLPLFGNSWDPGSDAPSSSADESALIRHALSSLDSSIQAPEAYASVRALIALKRYTYANQRIKKFASILEKLLIWCFFIRQASPFSLDSSDLEDFFSLCRRPPQEMLRSKSYCKRFILEADEVCVNPQWKPFWRRSNHHLGDAWERSALRFFYDHLKSQGLSDVVAKRRPTLGKKNSNVSAFEAIDVPRRYLQALAADNACSIKPRNGRASREKQVFVFATCFLLRIPFALLARSTQFFSMACFSYTSGSESFFRMNGEHEIIQRELTCEFLCILDKFRQRIGLHGPPQADEVQPIFRSSFALRHVWDSLPIFDFMKDPIGTYLREHMREQKVRRPSEKKASSHESHYDRRSRRTVRVAHDIVALSTKISLSYSSNALPPPLCTFDPGKYRSFLYADLTEASARVKAILGDLSVTDMKNLELFIYYANSAQGRRNRHKVQALEKLTTWCMFIKPIEITSIKYEQAIEFFVFCAEPPPAWCSNAPSRKFNSELGVSEWYPFRKARNIEAAHLRAAHIACWCSMVFQDLIDDGKLKSNGFACTAKQLASLRLH